MMNNRSREIGSGSNYRENIYIHNEVDESANLNQNLDHSNSNRAQVYTQSERIHTAQNYGVNRGDVSVEDGVSDDEENSRMSTFKVIWEYMMPGSCRDFITFGLFWA